MSSPLNLKSALTNIRAISPESRLSYNDTLSNEHGVDIFLKHENEKPIGSYKWRGAGNAVANLLNGDKERGVICASAGNHAQGVALASKKFDIAATIVMPKTAPKTKINKTQSLGGENVEIVLHGDTFDEAYTHAIALKEEKGSTFIHPFDSPDVVAGQATVAMEILSQMQAWEKNTELILVGNGGGGLLAGTQAAIHFYGADTKIIGVEPQNAASMTAALKNGAPIKIQTKETVADGAKVALVGQLGFEACRDNKIEILRSPEGRLCQTVLDLYDEHIIVEGAGALGVDGLKGIDPLIFEAIRKKRGAIVVVLSGGNMDPKGYDTMIERRDRYTGYKKDIVVRFPQREGTLNEFTSLLPHGVNIVHIDYNEKSNAASAPGRMTLTFDTPEIFERFQKITRERGFGVRVLKVNDEIL